LFKVITVESLKASQQLLLR